MRLTLLTCGGGLIASLCCSGPAPTIALTEEYGQFQIPPSASDVHVDAMSGMDALGRARFVLPDAEVDAFAGSIGCALTAVRDAYQAPLLPRSECDPEWWAPALPPAEGTRGCTVVEPGFVRALQVEPHPEGHLVYYQGHGM